MRLPSFMFILFLFVVMLLSFRNSMDEEESKPYVSGKFDSIVKTNDTSYFLFTTITLTNNSSHTIKYCSTLCRSPFICDNQELELDTRLSCDTDGVIVESIPPNKTESAGFMLHINKSSTKLNSKEFRIGFIYYTPNSIDMKNFPSIFDLQKSKYDETTDLKNHIIWSNTLEIK